MFSQLLKRAITYQISSWYLFMETLSIGLISLEHFEIFFNNN